MYPFFEAQASILFNMSSEQKAYCPAKLITHAVAEIKKCDMRGSHAGEHTQHAFVAVRCAVDSEFVSVSYGAAAVRLKYHENIRSVRRANIGKQAEDFKQLVVFLNQQEFLGGNINGNLPAFDNILKPEPQKSVKVKKRIITKVIKDPFGDYARIRLGCGTEGAGKYLLLFINGKRKHINHSCKFE